MEIRPVSSQEPRSYFVIAAPVSTVGIALRMGITSVLELLESLPSVSKSQKVANFSEDLRLQEQSGERTIPIRSQKGTWAGSGHLPTYLPETCLPAGLLSAQRRPG